MLDKYLKKIGLKGRQFISLPGAPMCLGPALVIASEIAQK
jgi:Fe2+ transport system protein B